MGLVAPRLNAEHRGSSVKRGSRTNIPEVHRGGIRGSKLTTNHTRTRGTQEITGDNFHGAMI